MNTSSYLKLSRHNVYIFRRRIPKSLIGLFKTNEIRISTKTTDKRTAIQLARIIASESEKLFEQLAENKNMADKNTPNLLSQAMKDWQIKHSLRTRLDELESENIEIVRASNKKIAALESSHEQVLKQQDSAYKYAIETLSKLASKTISNNAEDGHLKPESNSNRPDNHKSNKKVSELIDAYFSDETLKRRNVKLSTIRKDKDSLKLFLEIIGDKAISQVSQEDALKFADSCPTFGRENNTRRAISTINGYMNSVSNFSGWVSSVHSELGHTQLDFSRLRTRRTKRASEERAAFSNEEVFKILNHPKMKVFKTEEPVKFWLPHIAAYMGARLEEITQLSPMTDVYIEDGIWIIDINEKDGKSVKNLSSIRKLPIHSVILEFGFIEYIESLKKQNAKTLFPNETTRDGRTGKNAGKRVNRFIQKEVEIKDKSLHSFRHTFATILKRSGVNEYLAAELMGHKHGGVSYDRYGKGYLSNTLNEVIKKINFYQ